MIGYIDGLAQCVLSQPNKMFEKVDA